MNTRFFTATLAVMFLLCGGVSAAQDRVILFESSRGWSGPGEIREIEITEGGRGWSVVRSLELPAHFAAAGPVALADGSRILWLALIASGSTALVQYDVATARAAIVDVGRFGEGAFLLADRSAVRVFVVEPELARVTFLDARLRPESMAVPGTRRIAGAYVADGYLMLQRYSSTFAANDVDLVVIDTKSREILRTVRLFGMYGRVLVSNDGQRIYHDYLHSVGPRIDLISVATGELLARTPVEFHPAHFLFELDDTRGMLIHQSVVGRIMRRNAATLAVVDEFAPGVFTARLDFRLARTSNEAAVLVYSRQFVRFDCCEPSPTRIDVFDGRTFGLVNRIDLQERRPVIVPLPPR